MPVPKWIRREAKATPGDRATPNGQRQTFFVAVYDGRANRPGPLLGFAKDRQAPSVHYVTPSRARTRIAA